MAEDGPRVIDFGISHAVDNEALTVTGRLIGTPPFMSPEQFATPREVTAASDVFSLGSLLVYAATGNRPFDGSSQYLTGYQVMHETPDLDGVTEPLRSIAERCLDKDPDARPELAELQRMLRVLRDSPAPVASTTPVVPNAAAAPGVVDPAETHPQVSRTPSAPRRGRHILVGLAAAVAVTGVSITAVRIGSHQTGGSQPGSTG